MQIHLETLPHQTAALEAIKRSMPPLDSAGCAGSDNYANPLLKCSGEEAHFIDIKMETGTGKTYVYTRSMYELQQQPLGLYKFILIVPSLAIKEGAKNFILSASARQHFRLFFPNKRIELQMLNQGDFAARRGRKTMPTALAQFCEASGNDKNTIQCLLINEWFFSQKNSGLFKDDYDQTLFGGFNCPAEALAACRPIVLLDEPHRLKRGGKAYQNLMEKIKPQIILRFGATFPQIEAGKDKGKTDYYRGKPQYDLNAVEAFNQDLVKGVNIQYPNLPNRAGDKYRVKFITAKQLTLQKGGNQWELEVNDPLSVINADFGDLTYDGAKKLSNGQELERGMDLTAGIFSDSYQEVMLAQALEAHFKAEEENFCRLEAGQGYRVKTNALFFIDSISSYNNKDGWLRRSFERLLAQKLDRFLEKYTDGDYHDFLLATKQNLSGAHGGYFSEDRGKSNDDEKAAAIIDILQKEQSLPFKRPDGSWNIRRFFFSKWTLREGWDNPNIFTICKLRSSGSEVSKIQEVGRGLRLPVDEMGNRLAEREWFLNFLIGYDEKDFAQKLLGEINREAKLVLDDKKLTDAVIETLCKSRNMERSALLEELDGKNIINRDNSFAEGGYEKLLADYPELGGIKDGKITAPDRPAKTVKLRRENWEKIRLIWEKLSRRFMLVFEPVPLKELERLLAAVLADAKAFSADDFLEIKQYSTRKQGDALGLTESSLAAENSANLGKMPYNLFVSSLAERTCLPFSLLHNGLWAALKRLYDSGQTKQAVNAKLNEQSLQNILRLWQEKFAETFAQKYNYKALGFMADTSVIKNGDFVKELKLGAVGVLIDPNIKNDPRNLYEPPLAYDSEIERQIERINVPEHISVFGKVPRKAIKLPLYTGGTTTPDFIYAAQRNGKTELTLLVETKSEDLRKTEEKAVAAQRYFFEQLNLLEAAGSAIKWELVQKSEDIHGLLKELGGGSE